MTTELTPGEKIVWAAVYAKYWTGQTPETPTAVEMAWAAVVDMRDSRKAVLDGWGVGEQLAMLDEMLEENQP